MPQMGQIVADGENDKQTAQELKRPGLAKRSTVVEALVPRASERQAVGTTASTSAPSICANLRNLRIILPILFGLRRSFARAMPKEIS